jgi:hypothetical protein
LLRVITALEDIQQPIRSAHRGSSSPTTDSPPVCRALLGDFSHTAVKHLVFPIHVVPAIMHAPVVVADVLQVLMPYCFDFKYLGIAWT